MSDLELIREALPTEPGPSEAAWSKARAEIMAEVALPDPRDRPTQYGPAAPVARGVADRVAPGGISALRGPLPIRRRLARVALAAVGSALAIVAIATSGGGKLGPAPANAFAEWTAKPAEATPADVARAAKTCARNARGQWNTGTFARSLHLLDVRGPFLFALYGNGQTCMYGPGLIGTGITGPANSGIPTSHGIQLNLTTSWSHGGHGLAVLDGTTAAGVSQVALHRRGAKPIYATVEHGWYLMWWPGVIKPTTLTVTRDGQQHSFRVPRSVTSLLNFSRRQFRLGPNALRHAPDGP